jgi:mono/diheme cytochrome c family protein
MQRGRSAGAAAAIVIVAVATVAHSQSSAPPGVHNGVYTEEQAIRGQDIYSSRCLQCHGETLAGMDQAPPLTGPQFGGVWQGVPLEALVTRIGTMPPDAPGTLTRAQSVDVLAYILWYNGLPYGDAPLDPAQGSLTKIVFETLPPGASQAN